jgi:hypothetical protein
MPEHGTREDGGGLGVVTTHKAQLHKAYERSGMAGMEWNGMNMLWRPALACECPCRRHELNAERASDDAMQ